MITNTGIKTNNTNQKIYFRSISTFGVVSNIEANLLLNKGITEVGGFIIPQAIMANNKDESIERSFKSILYFLITFVSPLALLPIFNRKALSYFNITKNFINNDKKILEVSKKYLTKDGEFLKEGLKTKSQELYGHKNGFNSILERYNNDADKLRKDLINAHTSIHFTDLLTTNLMVASYPWIGNMFTKYRTQRSGYSGTYNMADEEFTKKDASKRKRTERLRQFATITLAALPALTLPFIIRKGMLKGHLKSNKFLNWFNRNAQMFDYKKAIYMSRATALAMWFTGDYLPNMFASRDKYELKDNFIRITLMDSFFWGGDLLLKKLLANSSDKLFKTHLINPITKTPYTLEQLKNYKNIESLKDLSPKIIRKTQKFALGLHIANLLILMSTLGFGLPYLLNKHLRQRINEDKEKENIKQFNPITPTLANFLNQKNPTNNNIINSFN